MGRVIAVAMAAFAVATASADAATVSRFGSTVTITAAGAEVNHISVNRTAAAVTVTDTMTNPTAGLASGCTASGNTATCNGVGAATVVADLGGGDDRFELFTATMLTVDVGGGAGNDTLRDGPGADALDGEADNDTVTGGLGADTVRGGAGVDAVSGGSAGDMVYGDAGDDTLSGGDGNDELHGGDDLDTLAGDLGSDTLYGEGGNDLWNGSADNDPDAFVGGPGFDTVTYAANIQQVAVTLDGLPFDGYNGIFDSVDASVDKVVGTDFDDILISDRVAPAELVGGPGKDTLIGGDAADILDGGAGDDTVAGGTGIDTITGGGGADRIFAITGGPDIVDADDGVADDIKCTGTATVTADAADAVDAACTGGTPGAPTPITPVVPQIGTGTNCVDPDVNPDGSLHVTSSLPILGAMQAGDPAVPLETPPGGGTPRKPIGMSDIGSQADGGSVPVATTAQIIGEMGMRLIRRDLQWHTVWPVHDDPICLKEFDTVYRTFTESGIRPLFVVQFAPRWAAKDNTNDSNCLVDNMCRSMPRTEALPEYAGLFKVLATRYPLALFEVHNEPDSISFDLNPDPDNYADGLRAARTGAELGRAGTRIVAFATTNAQWNHEGNGSAGEPKNWGAAAFIAVALHEGGLGNFDAASFHPYPTGKSPLKFRAVVGIVDRVLAAYGKADARLLATELGEFGAPNIANSQERNDQRDVLWDVYTDFKNASSIPALARLDALWMFTTTGTGDGGPTSKWAWAHKRGTTLTFTTTPVFCKFRADYGLKTGSCPLVVP